MKTALKKYKAWRSRRKLLALQRWEQIRAKGQARFVIQTSVTYGVAVTGILDVYDHIFYGGPDFSMFVTRAISFQVVGIGAAFLGWSDQEAKYQNALNAARANASPSGQLPPPRQASQISN